jgi:CMD domain protein
MTIDIIDQLAGVDHGSEVDALRERRPQARAQSQASYDALFNAPDATGVTRTERLAVAAFIAALHRAPSARTHYHDLLAAAEPGGLADLVGIVANAAAAEGPYGRFPSTADLRAEDAPGLVFRVDGASAEALGPRLTAAFEHVHLLVFRPRESSPEALAALQRAGWSTPEIVTLSQLAAFLSFQLRVVHGLRVLKESQS